MAEDIRTIPTDELKADLRDSLQDITDCGVALLGGISHYSGGSVRNRLKKNKHFVKVITAELECREMEAKENHDKNTKKHDGRHKNL